MNKHTPGPWNVAHALSGKMFVTIDHNIGMARKQVCEIIPDIDTGDFHDNARLIAAAPEMLEALEGMILSHGYVNRDTLIPEPEPCDCNECKQARALIAKVRGE